jgi:hypothetical protein
MSTPETVWITSAGGAYHTRRGCGRGEFLPSFRQFAEAAGLEPCGRCAGEFECEQCGATHTTNTEHARHVRSCDGPGRDVSPETVRDCADAVETLGELADLLAVSDGEARLRAREAGVLNAIRDDIERMGVGK